MELCCRNRGTCCCWNPSPSALLITAWLSFWIQHTSGQTYSSAEVINAILGEVVTITGPVKLNIVEFTWFRGTAELNEQVIITFYTSGSRKVTGPRYTGQQAGLSDGALVITDVRTNDTGYYLRNIMLQGAAGPETLIKQLRVYERVSVPIISAEPEKPIENETLILNCKASGTEVFYQWFLNDSMVFAGGRIFLSNDSQTLALSPCIKSDTGSSFTCRAYNAVSSATSRPFIISFDLKDHYVHRRRKLPAWAIAVIVTVVLTSVVFFIALVRYHFIKHPLSGTHKQQRPVKGPAPASSSNAPAIAKVNTIGQNVKSEPDTKLEDLPASPKDTR